MNSYGEGSAGEAGGHMPEVNGSRQELGQVATGLAEQFRIMGEQIARGMREFMESPAGQYMQGVAKWAEEHPDELSAMIATREAAAALSPCDCLCQRWGHLGACQGYATATVPLGSPGHFQVEVRMCPACAGDVRSQQVPA